MPEITVIIPSLNDGECLRARFSRWPADARWEILVVEAGKPVALPSVSRVIRSAKANRAYQMNRGARSARAPILLFLHADTQITPDSLEFLMKTLEGQPKYVGGCYQFSLNSSSWRARMMELGVLLREMVFRLPYGDQALFVRKEVFRKIKGFPEVPVLEDVLFVRRLQKMGRLLYFEHPAVTSARKWEARGYFATMCLNWWTMFQWQRGVSLDKLAELRQKWFSHG